MRNIEPFFKMIVNMIVTILYDSIVNMIVTILYDSIVNMIRTYLIYYHRTGIQLQHSTVLLEQGDILIAKRYNNF